MGKIRFELCSLLITVVAVAMAPSMALGQGGPPCDLPPQPLWSSYGQNLEQERCTFAAALPTANNVDDLTTKWDKAHPAGVTAAPIVDATTVYYGDHNNDFFAVDRQTGAVQWQTNLANPNSLFEKIRGSAFVTQHHVYIATSTFLYKLDKNTGAEIWGVPVDSHFAANVDSSPIVVGGTVVLGIASWELSVDTGMPKSFRGSIVAFDTETGDEIWRTYTTSADAASGAGVGVWASAAVDVGRNMLFMGTGNAYAPPAAPLSDTLLALDLDDGSIIWKHQYEVGDIFSSAPPMQNPGPDADIGATANLFKLEGVDVVGVGNKSGYYKIFKRTDGTLIREIKLPTGRDVVENGAATLGGIMGSAVVANDVIYVNSNIWRTRPPSFVVGALSAQDTSVTYAIDALTGDILWERALPAPHFGGLTKVNDLVFHTLLSGKLIALNAGTGAIEFDSALGGPAGGGVTASLGHIFVSYGFNFRNTPVAAPATAGVRAYSLD